MKTRTHDIAGKEPLGAALLAVCILRGLREGTPRRESTAREAYAASAEEFEKAAIELLKQTADTNKKLSSLLLVRRMPQLGNATVFELAKKAHALKFMASPICQVCPQLHTFAKSAVI